MVYNIKIVIYWGEDEPLVGQGEWKFGEGAYLGVYPGGGKTSKFPDSGGLSQPPSRKNTVYII